MTISTIVKNQRDFFATKATLDVAYRRKALLTLKKAIETREDAIYQALKTDLNKSEFEAYATELGMVYEELNFMLKHLSALARPKKKSTPLVHFPTSSYTYSDPYGCVLIMSPWNYPLQLTLSPLVGAIAAGNCAVVKPSNYSPATSAIIGEILGDFPDEYIAVAQGGRAVNQELLEERFDYIFFTGSTTVGKLVMEKAAKYLTPITLELGGKSPCIVDETAKIDQAAKRIVWGKLLNSGQTCVAPDYLLVHHSVKDQLLTAMKKYITAFYGENPLESPEYPKIITKQHFDRLCALIPEELRQVNEETLQIAPVFMDNSDWDSEVMEKELFGPIFPVITYTNLTEAIAKINSREKPLALYLFTTSKAAEKEVLTTAFYGGGCVNDTIIHLANSALPFGGVGYSGMGSYHGKASYSLFSHTKSIAKKSTLLDVPVRYAPFKGKMWLLKLFM